MAVTKSMVQFAFVCFKIADILNIFPFTLNQKTGKFSYEASKLTSATHNFCFGVSCIKCFQLGYALISKLVESNDSQMAVTILTGLWGSLCTTSTFWSYELFHKRSSETILLFNSLDFPRAGHDKTTNAGGSNWKKAKIVITLARVMPTKKQGLRQLVKTLLRLNIQELLLVASPYAVNIFVPIYLGIMALFPHWSVFATSLSERGSWIFWLSIGGEFVAAVCMQLNILFLFFFELALQSFHFGNIDAYVLDGGVTELKNAGKSRENLDACMNLFDYYHVIVKLANVLFSRVLFTGKLMAFSCSIFGTYYVMTHIHSASPILLVFFTSLSIDAIGFYVISCKRLFEVPAVMGKMKSLCRSLLDVEKAKLSPWDVKVRDYKIQSMPLIGISDGGFRYMDSISTLEFIDFYLNQVISLLLM